VFFAGGGVRGGTVIGSSDKVGGYPASSPQTPENLAATIYDALGIPQDAHWLDEQGRPNLFYHGTPIPGLMG
jgi:Ni,Fe-hydrogenase I small subunit